MVIYFLILPGLLLALWLAVSIKRLQQRGRRSPINENILRTPAHSLRRAQTSNAVDLLSFIFGVFGTPFYAYALIYAYALNPGNVLVSYVGYGLAAAMTGWCFYRAIKTSNIAIRMHQAVEAEVTTGQELNLLMRDGAWVFHDIPYQYGNIDHVIVSNGGVFAIETKGISKPTNNKKSSSENSSVMVEHGVLVLPHARTKQPIDQAKTHAKWLRNEIQRRFELSIPVRAVVALPGWMIKGGFDGDCWVINPKRGNSLRGAVTQSLISDSDVKLISAWVEDLARSVVPKSKEFDPRSELTY